MQGQSAPISSPTPTPDETEVFVGMTRWESMEAFGKAGEKLLPTPIAGNFFATFDMKAYVQVQLIKGDDFDLNTLAKNGQILEVAVRTYQEGKKEEFEQAKVVLPNCISNIEKSTNH